MKQQGKSVDERSYCLKFCNKHERYVISEVNHPFSAVYFIDCRRNWEAFKVNV